MDGKSTTPLGWAQIYYCLCCPFTGLYRKKKTSIYQFDNPKFWLKTHTHTHLAQRDIIKHIK